MTKPDPSVAPLSVTEAPLASALVADLPRRAPRARDRAVYVETLTVLACASGGLWCAQGAAAWYRALAVGFVGIAAAVLAGAGLVTWLCERQPDRLQGPRRRPALNERGARDTALAAFIAACFLAWPLVRARSGLRTGLTWRVADAGGPLAVVLGTIAAVLVLDAWLYWKHRLLHTRALFAFHRGHHVYRDPSAFAGFAVGPVESVLTFWPLALVAVPRVVHYAPVYFSLVVGFVTLNFYLHCGVVVPAIEMLLPRLGVNTSVFHNRHHANADVNFGEALTVWDRLLGTNERR